MNYKYILYILIFTFSFSFLSCKKAGKYDIRADKASTRTYSKRVVKPCKVLVDEFVYPVDLERLDTFSYICDPEVPFKDKIKPEYYQYFYILFSDKNYMLVEYDLFTRLLYDKRENIWFVFKASEAGNFDFKLHQKEGGNLYGFSAIYVVNNKLMPVFMMFNNNDNPKIIKFYNDDKKKRYSIADIKLLENNPININFINYKQLINLSKLLLSGKYVEGEVTSNDDMFNYFYDNPPIWTENW